VSLFTILVLLLYFGSAGVCSWLRFVCRLRLDLDQHLRLAPILPINDNCHVHMRVEPGLKLDHFDDLRVLQQPLSEQTLHLLRCPQSHLQFKDV
jgi:hypothetical protein